MGWETKPPFGVKFDLRERPRSVVLTHIGQDGGSFLRQSQSHFLEVPFEAALNLAAWTPMTLQACSPQNVGIHLSADSSDSLFGALSLDQHSPADTISIAANGLAKKNLSTSEPLSEQGNAYISAD
ncbi:hypothetical protein MesoLj131a_57190 [Mesorhizobium sp. 131-2-1]|nr:hypothetical protein MesoLj131a_57190 [Mesorhizobium sp. 131-2-1]